MSIYVEGDIQFTCNVNVTNLRNSNNSIKLVVYLIESDIIQWQKDYDADPIDVEFYRHDFVLRAGFTNAWGESIPNNGIDKNYSIDILDDWDPNNCSIVAFVYNTESCEILQAEWQRLINNR
jgi:hypothetical protein